MQVFPLPVVILVLPGGRAVASVVPVVPLRCAAAAASRFRAPAPPSRPHQASQPLLFLYSWPASPAGMSVHVR